MEAFGKTAEGEDVRRITICGGGLTANIINWGAVVQDLRMDGHAAPLVLGFQSFEDYPARSPYFGAIAGRCANRIANGRFTIDGETFQADTNFLSKHALHGGSVGIGKRVWQIAETGDDFVKLTHRDKAGLMGFPGNLDIQCTYRLAPPNRMIVELDATCDEPTLCNLTHHSYFNLDDGGTSDILDHRLMVAADAYLPVDEELIPTGVVQPVADTQFDFRHARPIRQEVHDTQLLYDHNFCLSAGRRPLNRAAWAQGAESGVELEVWTTEPGIQFYSGGGIKDLKGGLDGNAYLAHSGFCLEAQLWPDAPNRPYFPDPVLRPGIAYRQVTEYRFRRAIGEFSGL